MTENTDTNILETPPANAHVAPQERQERLQKIRELIDRIAVCMVTTTGVDGSIHSRPMAYLHMEEDGELLFFTKVSSTKVNEVKRNSNVNVTFADLAHNRYVSISGHAWVVNDMERIQALFTPVMKTFFPGGVEDPTLRLFVVEPFSAEYWDGPSGLAFLFHVAKSALTGDNPAEIGEHSYLEL